MRTLAIPPLSKPVLVALVIALAALLSGAGIAQHVFWDDEANTAVIARNLLHTGTLTAWDGTNLMAWHGGEDLDGHLVERTVPALQYYVAAAGMAVFGETTLAARLPFLALGLAALWLLARWTALQMGPRFPAWLPPLILALNVSFLLYIRQCRYYALTLFFFALIGWSWARLGERRSWWLYPLGASAALGLFYANYITGLAALAAFASLLVERRWRDRAHLLFLALAGAAVGGGVLLVMAVNDPLTSPAYQPGRLQPALELMLWQLRGLGEFELVPLLFLPLLALPFLGERLRPLRAPAKAALAMVLALVALLLATSLISPQPMAFIKRADMRYVLPVLLLGSIAVAATLLIVREGFGHVAAFGLFAVLALSNAEFPGFFTSRCTLCEYVQETLSPHPSSGDALVAWAKRLPAGTDLHTIPGIMTDALLFYAPELHYSHRLENDKPLDPAIRARLPDYLFANRVPTDVWVQAVGPTPLLPGMMLSDGGRLYRVAEVLPILWFDGTKPDLPLHIFRADPAADAAHGIAVLRPSGSASFEQAQTN